MAQLKTQLRALVVLTTEAMDEEKYNLTFQEQGILMMRSCMPLLLMVVQVWQTYARS
jgi:hypothetical protein